MQFRSLTLKNDNLIKGLMFLFSSDRSNNTWEPESNLSKETVDSFNKTITKKNLSHTEMSINNHSTENTFCTLNSKHSYYTDSNAETSDSQQTSKVEHDFVEKVLNKRVRNGMKFIYLLIKYVKT